MADDLVKELKIKRGVIKGKLTRLETFVNGVDRDKLDDEIVNNLQLRLGKGEPLWEEFQEVQGQLDLVDSVDNSDNNEQERELFENGYYRVIGRIKSMIQSSLEYPDHNSDSGGSRIGSQHSQISADINRTQINSSSIVKLPPIKLPVFDGQYSNWVEFKELFTTLVGQDPGLNDIQKFYYLKTSLTETVKETIKSIEVSAQNYQTVWQILTDRYENKKLIIYKHMREIFEQPTLSKESHTELRNLFDTVNKHLRALHSLGEKTEYWDRMIIYILTQKFDPRTRRDWESHKCEGEVPQFKDLENFLKSKCEILEKLEVSSGMSSGKGNNFNKSQAKYPSNNKRSSSNALAAVTEEKYYNCYYCNANHSIYKCADFMKLTPEGRIEEVKRLKLCLNCLRTSHPSWKCTAPKCRECKKPHNSLLHKVDKDRQSVEETMENKSTDKQLGAAEPSASVSLTLQNVFEHKQVLLCTALLKIRSSDNKWHTCRALLDSASQSNFVTEKLCNKLGLPRLQLNHAVKGVGQILTNINNQVDILIKSNHNSYSKKLRCLVLPHITDNLPSMSFDRANLNIPLNLQLADPEFNISSEVDVLLGAGVFWSVLCGGQDRRGLGASVMQNTLFGWVIAGDLNVTARGNNNNTSLTYFVTNDCQDSVNNQLMKFWDLEEVANQQIHLSESQKRAEAMFQETTVRESDGRFQVQIPFKPNLSDLGESYERALQRFKVLESKLNKNEFLRQEYVSFMNEYANLNHMSEVQESNVKLTEGYFLAHHAVVKASSVTTRCRVVFDASAKTTTGLSLNDVQYIGPTLQQDIFSILTRFRQYQFVMTADISKMYRQILISEGHRKYQRILWRPEPSQTIKIYELNRVTYGNASSPYLAVRCLFQLAEENYERHPKACDIIRRDFYMDDLLTGANTVAELLDLQRNLSNILLSAGFELRKWLCNKGDILKQFEVNPSLDVGVLELGEYELNKTLGVYWNSNKDVIQYKLNIKDKTKITKRIILSITCQIFDPLGLLGPIVINAKVLLQELWKLKLDWDDEVPLELRNKWQFFEGNLEGIVKLAIPRQAILSEYVSIELHGFCDSSIKAYGACIYVRCVSARGDVTSRLLCAKSRVAPIKQQSLPRLELCGAVLLARLMERVGISMEIKFNERFYWTDSTITLSWIRGSSDRWKTFVANRVSEIQSLSNITEWHHVASADNPADLLSRGLTASQLLDCELWWYGPTWFLLDSSSWQRRVDFEVQNIPEQKATTSLVVVNKCEFLDELLNKYSSVKKLQCVFAYVLRFISNIKKKKQERQTGALTPDEVETALNVLIKFTQINCFPAEYVSLKNKKPLPQKSKILALNPFMAEDLLRVGGRLRNAEQHYNKKYPIILPKGNTLTQLLLREEHERLLHGGVQLMLGSIRERFWPLSGRNSCKQVVRNCIICFKAKPRESTYLMGNLPDVRVNNSFPFLNVGLDCGGPYLVKDRRTRNAKLLKSYICIFVCMCTRAVHIELVTELTTEAFLATLNRFTSRRGVPQNIYSDNGRNFVGANNELSKIGDFLTEHETTIAGYLANQRIKWNFIPARSPNFGGIWEAGIKSTKYHIKRLLNSPLCYEEFSTLLIRIEGILNSRPLCPISQDPEDMSVLTAAHFLIGRPLTALPELNVTTVPENRLKMWQRVQALAQHFWVRWSKEVLSELQTRVKWRQRYPQLLKVGALVLIKNENAPSMLWHMGRVSCLIPGKDGVVRVVKVKTANGEISRAVTKICVLPIDC